MNTPILYLPGDREMKNSSAQRFPEKSLAHKPTLTYRQPTSPLIVTVQKIFDRMKNLPSFTSTNW